MAIFSVVLGRSASSLAKRAVGTQRNYSSAIFNNTTNSFCRRTSSCSMMQTTTTSTLHFSSSAKTSNTDLGLLRVLDLEIQCAQKSYHDRVEIPAEVPFQIQDNPEEKTITLRRKHEDEVIKVEVQMPDLVTGEDEDEDDKKDNDEEADESSIPLVVSVSKGNGTCLEFGCTAYPDEISLESLIVRKEDAPENDLAYEGPEFSDLDENLQKALYKYLEIRGIKPSLTNFLHEYMIDKDSREYLLWLKNLKKFVEK